MISKLKNKSIDTIEVQLGQFRDKLEVYRELKTKYPKSKMKLFTTLYKTLYFLYIKQIASVFRFCGNHSHEASFDFVIKHYEFDKETKQMLMELQALHA